MSRTRFNALQKQLSTETVGIVSIPEGDDADADKLLKERLPIINCECGAEILVVPDLQAMNRAIKTHVAEHRQKERSGGKGVITSGNINQLLNQLALIKMSEQSKYLVSCR